MATELSPRQRELLQYLEDCIGHERRMPSYREMAKALKVSAVGTVQDLVRALIDRGYLEKDGKKLKLAGARHSGSITIPILGEVAAGTMHKTFEVALGSLPLPPHLLSRKNVRPDQFFALRVKGDSMMDAGILEKDYVIVDREVRAKDGDIVVALVEDEATIKELELPKKSGAPVRLLPHNPRFKPIVIEDSAQLSVLGKVVGLQRYFG